MISRKLPRLHRRISSRDIYARASSSTRRTTPHPRRVYTATTIADPTPNAAHPSPSISLAHPKDPANLPGSSQSTGTSNSSPSPPPPGNTTVNLNPPPPHDADAAPPSSSSSENVPVLATLHPQPPQSNLPAPHIPSSTNINAPYGNPPFHTHHFFTALERTFPTPTARSLMRATRALLVDRLGRVKRDALTGKDLESVCPDPGIDTTISSDHAMLYSKRTFSRQRYQNCARSQRCSRGTRLLRCEPRPPLHGVNWMLWMCA